MNKIKELIKKIKENYLKINPAVRETIETIVFVIVMVIIIRFFIAEIRWILAHSTPWLRGSDAISNVFMRAMYKAVGIKTYPLKKGISLDLEAYCTELDEYKKKFPAYFEKPPEIIE